MIHVRRFALRKRIPRSAPAELLIACSEGSRAHLEFQIPAHYTWLQRRADRIILVQFIAPGLPQKPAELQHLLQSAVGGGFWSRWWLANQRGVVASSPWRCWGKHRRSCRIRDKGGIGRGPCRGLKLFSIRQQGREFDYFHPVSLAQGPAGQQMLPGAVLVSLDTRPLRREVLKDYRQSDCRRLRPRAAGGFLLGAAGSPRPAARETVGNAVTRSRPEMPLRLRCHHREFSRQRGHGTDWWIDWTGRKKSARWQKRLCARVRRNSTSWRTTAETPSGSLRPT